MAKPKMLPVKKLVDICRFGIYRICSNATLVGKLPHFDMTTGSAKQERFGRLGFRSKSNRMRSEQSTIQPVNRISPCGIARQGAFSLVEITLAMGIVTFSMMVIVGLLPVGLQSMQDSSVQYGMASIRQQISSELQEMPFIASDSNPGYSITALSDSGNARIDYFTRDGVKTTATATGMNTYPYYAATYSTNDPAIPGATSSYPSNLQMVKVTISYPYQAPQSSRQTNVLSFLVAKQSSL